MTQPNGLDTPFQLLFADQPSAQPSLPDAFRRIYPGDWQVLRPQGRPYIYSNLAISRDGRISYNEPGARDAPHVTKANPHDRWLMGLLRMWADALLIGDTTIRLEKEHFETADTICPWTAQFICPGDAAAFAALRDAEGHKPLPILVVLSLDGAIELNAQCFTQSDRQIILATTTSGAENARRLAPPPTVKIHTFGQDSVDLLHLTQRLYQEYDIQNLLCEGGATVLANMLNAGLIDEEFVTWCPVFVGRNQDHFRPSYTEGIPWMPDQAPYSKPISLHRGGDYLFLRTKCEYLNNH